MSGGDNEVSRAAIDQEAAPVTGATVGARIDDAEVVYDTSFEVDLDPEEDRPAPGKGKPVYVDVTITEHQVLPIIPANLQTWAGIKSTIRRRIARAARIGAYHGVRTPVLYVPLGLFWSVIGVFRLAWRQIAWWLDLHAARMEQNAVLENDHKAFKQARAEGNARRLFRGVVLGGELVGVAVGLVALRLFAPWWAQFLAVAALVPVLAHAGRPQTKPIVRSAVVEPRHRLLTGDVVLRAYYSAKLGDPDKPGQQIKFGSRMSRDSLDQGSEVVIDLPYGKTYADAVKAKEAVASGLDVTENQVFLTRDRTSVRRHKLYVADVDPLGIPAGRGPLLDLKPRDIWKAAPLGLDERGRLVSVALMWNSVLVGAQPRKGKTFSARLLALYAALDPYVKVTIADGKDAPDWKMFRLVAHRLIMGTVPHKPGDPDPIEELILALREIKKHIQQVNAFLSALPPAECPDGKLTRELSRKYPNLRVWLLVMEEFQVYYELDDKDTCMEIAGLLSFIMAVGPSAGVIILSSSQKPSGIGSGGDVQRLFNRFRDNHAVRFALKCGNRNVSEAVLGTEAYGEGHDASALPIGPEYKGVGILYGAADQVPRVRCHHITGEDAEKIIKAARRHREALGTLTGLAAGEDIAREFRDVLRDVRDVYRAGEAWISWGQIASRLADTWPEHYADLNQDAISAQVRAFKVKSENGRVDGQVLKGAKVAAIEAAIERRSVESGR